MVLPSTVRLDHNTHGFPVERYARRETHSLGGPKHLDLNSVRKALMFFSMSIKLNRRWRTCQWRSRYTVPIVPLQGKLLPHPICILVPLLSAMAHHTGQLFEFDNRLHLLYVRYCIVSISECIVTQRTHRISPFIGCISLRIHSCKT